MNLPARLALFAIPLLLLSLTVLAGYAYTQIRALSLPIPKALALFTVVLPFVTGISTQSLNNLIRKSSKNDRHQLTLPLIGIIGFQLIYETVVATLALTHILPPSSLVCGLNDNWQRFFNAKDADSIRAIQDKLKCCGFRTVKDRAFPFGTPSTCARDFGRQQSCADPWRGAEQVTAGLLLLVAVLVFILKVLAVISLLTRASWTRSPWAQPFLPANIGAIEEPEEDHRAVVRRLIEDGTGDRTYHDDAEETSTSRALEATPNGGNDHGPRVQPSPLIDVDNEWRDEGGDRRA